MVAGPMKQHRASLTSEMIAMCRAMHVAFHDDPIIVDRHARSMIRPAWRAATYSQLLYKVLIRAGMRFDWAIAHSTARSRVAEDRLDELRTRGPVQWVLLGAGLDMFAWRRSDCAQVPQFEVDHPATQRAKRDKLRALGLLPPAGHHFVEVDFERETASDKLRGAGFSTTVPTVFAWLGVTYYLKREAIEASLRDIRQVAAPGSYLVFDWRLADRYLRDVERAPVHRSDRVFARWGEPMLSRLEPDDMHAIVRAAGWSIAAEHTSAQLAERYFEGGRDGLVPTSIYRVIEAVPA
jgi:methyltransferase (TIGR00027 family)